MDVRYDAIPVADGGDEQTTDVLGMMARYAVDDAGSSVIQAEAAEAIRQRPDLEPWQAIWYWVKSRLRFVRDEITGSPIQPRYASPVVEVLIRPVDMATLCSWPGAGPGCQRMGDCDDYSMYLAALLLAAGLGRVVFVTVAADGRSTDYSHVYVALYLPDGRRVALDASHGDYPGWEVEDAKVQRRQEWPVGGGILDGLLPLVVAAAVVTGAIILCR